MGWMVFGMGAGGEGSLGGGAGLVRRGRRPSSHLVAQLRRREEGLGPARRRPWPRSFYSALTPNATIVNVETPLCFLRRFSPDGDRLVAFGAQQSSLEIYSFLGVAEAGELLNSRGGVEIRQDGELGSPEIRARLFESLFRLSASLALVPPANAALHLNRECSLFTADGRHVIVAASGAALAAQPSPAIGDWFRNSESLAPSLQLGLEDVLVFCVDILIPRLCDTLKFPSDKIILAHNHGLYLYERRLFIHSLQHQTIHIYSVDESSGVLVPIQSIGRFLFDSDEMFISLCQGHADDPHSRTIYSGLKQRLLSYLYREAQTGSPAEAWARLRKLYARWDSVLNLKMLRLQALDAERLLIRWASEDFVRQRVVGDVPPTTASLISLYNINTAVFEAVWDPLSRQLLQLYESDPGAFRQPDARGLALATAANSTWAREGHEHYKRSLCSSKTPGPPQIRKRLLGLLPIPAQSFSSSPFLDPELFSYDDKLVSPLERPKRCGDCPLRFYSRADGGLLFQLYCGLLARAAQPPAKDARSLVAFLFHPVEPFVISVQRRLRPNDARYVLNFHLRSDLPNPDGVY